jgi:hypothetical protein
VESRPVAKRDSVPTMLPAFSLEGFSSSANPGANLRSCTLLFGGRFVDLLLPQRLKKSLKKSLESAARPSPRSRSQSHAMRKEGTNELLHLSTRHAHHAIANRACATGLAPVRLATVLLVALSLFSLSEVFCPRHGTRYLLPGLLPLGRNLPCNVGRPKHGESITRKLPPIDLAHLTAARLHLPSRGWLTTSPLRMLDGKADFLDCNARRRSCTVDPALESAVLPCPLCAALAVYCALIRARVLLRRIRYGRRRPLEWERGRRAGGRVQSNTLCPSSNVLAAPSANGCPPRPTVALFRPSRNVNVRTFIRCPKETERHVSGPLQLPKWPLQNARTAGPMTSHPGGGIAIMIRS